jgi:AraC family transcriptional regulator
MIITSLPDPDSHCGSPVLEESNTVIFASTQGKYFYPRHETPYLFLTNFLNPGDYILNKEPIKISDQNFYFMNPGDELEIKFRKSVQIKTLLIQFDKKFIDDIFHSNTSSDKKLLENNLNRNMPYPELPPAPFYINKNIRQHIGNLLQGNFVSKDRIDELLFNLISEFLLLNHETASLIKKIKVVKMSTRLELYKRLFLARQFMDDNVFGNVKIEQIAKEVCLNKFHFLKNFKDLYDITPHQYLMEIKLEKAYQQLKTKRYTVGEVCNTIGFQSEATFSHLFKRKFKVPPSVLVKSS